MDAGVVAGIVGTVIGALGVAWTGYLAHRNKVSERNHAKDLAQLAAENIRRDMELFTMKAAYAECQSERKAEKEEMAAVKTRWEAAITQCNRVEGELNTMKQWTKELQQELRALIEGRSGKPSHETPDAG